jgi:cobalt-zinc-cadmium efflux system outer membrane protein
MARFGAAASARLGLLSAVVCLPTAGSAAELGLAAFLDRVREQDPRVAVWRAEQTTADAEVVSAGGFENPSLAWERAHVRPGDGGAAEDDFVVTLPMEMLDLSGRRARAVRAAEAGRAAVDAQVEWARVERGADAASLYFTVLHACAVAADAAEARGRLDTLAADLRARVAAGDAAAFDADRLDAEVAVFTDEAQDATTRCESGQLRLGGEVGLDRVRPTEPLVLPATAAVVETAPADPDHPGLVAARAERAAAAEVRARADRAWVPPIRLIGGARRVDDDLGYIAGLTLDLPLSSPEPGEAERAAARVARSEAALGTEERRLAVEVSAAAWALSGRRAAAARAEAHRAQAEALLPRAVSAWREGERSLVELLDTQRQVYQARLRVLDRQLAVRLADIHLNRARGRAPETR